MTRRSLDPVLPAPAVPGQLRLPFTTTGRAPVPVTDSAAWSALAVDRLGHAVGPVATLLARWADPTGLLDPPPTVVELTDATGLDRLPVRRALSALIAGGLLATDGERLALPGKGGR